MQVGPDTVIHPGVHLEGHTRVGAACEIYSGVRIVDSTLEDRVTVKNYCVIQESRIAAGASLGPFAHLRTGTEVREDARVGNFVELKKTVLGTGSKANHLAYLGDATIGSNVKSVRDDPCNSMANQAPDRSKRPRSWKRHALLHHTIGRARMSAAGPPAETCLRVARVIAGNQRFGGWRTEE